MTTIWQPHNKIEAELMMRIEAAKFQMVKVNAEIAVASERLVRAKMLIDRLEENMKFLESPAAQIVSMIEYRAMNKELKALCHEKETLTKVIKNYKLGQEALKKEIEETINQLQGIGANIIKFRRKNEE